MTVRRCAVYTRKSTEEGLEQSFNSLHAQRDACEAFIKSQMHEGWKLIPDLYDDGGFSGGSIERPALKRLLEHVKCGLVDIVVVYKVDRLTRSLADFAKIVDVLDAHNACFVSVTQQFNTTTSMGRLTLNVLLSFAQFEREVAGERIRDKVAASKRRGMWMGGRPPLGYDVKQRRLVVNLEEAALVRKIFIRYTEFRCVGRLQQELATQNVRSKVILSAKGTRRGGGLVTRTMLYRLLANPTYVGRVPHQSTSYPGQHEPIIDNLLWDQAQAILAENTRTRGQARAPFKGSPLGGLLFDDRGNVMTPSFSNKGQRQRYRYYISQSLLQNDAGGTGSIGRVPAALIERLVADAVRERREMAAEPDLQWHKAGDAVPLRQLLERVTVSRSSIEILLRHLSPPRILLRGIFVRHGRGLTFERLDSGRVIEKKRASMPVLKAICRAVRWRQLVESGKVQSYHELARHERMNPGYVRRLMQLAFLSPAIIEAVLAGHSLLAAGVVDLTTLKIPLSWARQRALLLPPIKNRGRLTVPH